MKTNKNHATICYVAAVLFYLAAIFHFAGSSRSSGVVCLALGSAFLCFGSARTGKAKKDDHDGEQRSV